MCNEKANSGKIGLIVQKFVLSLNQMYHLQLLADLETVKKAMLEKGPTGGKNMIQELTSQKARLKVSVDELVNQTFWKLIYNGEGNDRWKKFEATITDFENKGAISKKDSLIGHQFFEYLKSPQFVAQFLNAKESEFILCKKDVNQVCHQL